MWACHKQSKINESFLRISTEHYKSLCNCLLLEWKNLAIVKIQRRKSLLERTHALQARRFFAKLRLQTQLSHVKKNVLSKIKSLFNNRLKQKSIASLKAYLTSDSCANQKKSKEIRSRLLRKKGLVALKQVSQLQA